MSLKEIIENSDIASKDGKYVINISSGEVVVEECDKTKEYILALEQKIAHASSWLFLAVVCILIAVLTIVNTTNLNQPLDILKGWGSGITMVVIGISVISFLPSVLNKKRAARYVSEFSKKAEELNFCTDSLLSEEWVDKKAFNVKNLIIAGIFKK